MVSAPKTLTLHEEKKIYEKWLEKNQSKGDIKIQKEIEELAKKNQTAVERVELVQSDIATL